LLIGILKIGFWVWTAQMAGPGEQGNEPTYCIQGREFNKIAEQLLASQEGPVLHSVIVSNYFEICIGEILHKNYCTRLFISP
jgi:hypothetical protein